MGEQAIGDAIRMIEDDFECIVGIFTNEDELLLGFFGVLVHCIPYLTRDVARGPRAGCESTSVS